MHNFLLKLELYLPYVQLIITKSLYFRLIAGAGAEGCFLIPFVLSMEVVGVKVSIFSVYIRGVTIYKILLAID